MPYLYKAHRMPHLHTSPPDYLEAEAVGVATTCRLLKITGLFCRISSLL